MQEVSRDSFEMLGDDGETPANGVDNETSTEAR
jgi:hypothetical protein